MNIFEKLLKPFANNKTQYQDLSKESQKLPQNNPSELFMCSRDIAGKQLQQNFLQSDEYSWIRCEYTYPSFDDMNFIHKTDIFSVIIDIQDKDGVSYLPEEYIKRQLYASHTYNLIPCKFPVVVPDVYNPDLSQLVSKTQGWNLFNTETDNPINPETVDDEKLCEMSDWEMRNLGIRFVMEYLKAKNLKVLGFQDTLEVDPQLWFLDASGKKCWMIVRCEKKSEQKLQKPEKLNEIIRRCFKYDGYFSGLVFEPKNSDSGVIYRGNDIKTKFNGIEKIHSVM